MAVSGFFFIERDREREREREKYGFNTFHFVTHEAATAACNVTQCLRGPQRCPGVQQRQQQPKRQWPWKKERKNKRTLCLQRHVPHHALPHIARESVCVRKRERERECRRVSQRAKTQRHKRKKERITLSMLTLSVILFFLSFFLLEMTTAQHAPF